MEGALESEGMSPSKSPKMLVTTAGGNGSQPSCAHTRAKRTWKARVAQDARRNMCVSRGISDQPINE